MIEDFVISENLEDLYENAPCGYISFLGDGLIIKTNQTLLNWIGRERGDVISKLKFQDLISLGEVIFFETQIGPLLKMNGLADEIHFNLKTSTSARIPVLTSTKRALVSDRQVVVNRMTLFNIADRKRFEMELKAAREKAEAAAKSKSDFLSMLSHEIRTPLNAVIGVSNLLDSTELSREQEPFMEMLRNSSDNLLNLLNSILDLSKIEAGKIELDNKPFAIRKLVDANLSACQGLAREKKLSLSSEVDPNIPLSAVGDAVKLTQVISNLLGNAIKFTSSGFVVLRLTLQKLSPVEMTIRFEVQDSGIGIAEQKLSKIFGEFAQAEKDTSAKFGGTGLGLSISQKLVALYGAMLDVTSELGRGTTFSFEVSLPIGDVKADTHGIERVANQAGALKGLNVLVADDSADNIALMKHLFKKWGSTFDVARNGEDAVEKVKSQDYDAVLMDIRMPIKNGYDAAVEIRALVDAEKRLVPIIAFSGSNTFEGHDIKVGELFNAVLGKPFKPLDLVARLLPYSRF